MLDWRAGDPPTKLLVWFLIKGTFKLILLMEHYIHLQQCRYSWKQSNVQWINHFLSRWDTVKWGNLNLWSCSFIFLTYSWRQISFLFIGFYIDFILGLISSWCSILLYTNHTVMHWSTGCNSEYISAYV